MKLKRLFAIMFVFVVGLLLASCGGPKAVNAYDKVDEAKEFCAEQLGVGENDTIEFSSIKFVEITYDELVSSLVGDVYYCISYKITRASGMTEMSTIYPVYSAEEDKFFNWNDGGKSYKEFKDRVEREASEGVIDTIE